MKNKIALIGLALLLCGSVQAQDKGSAHKVDMKYKEWAKEERKFTPDFYTTPEAARIADNVLLYQQTTGGWPKNIYYPAPLSEEQKAEAVKQKTDVNLSTIDNNATTVEIRFLANMYNATHEAKYKQAVERGIAYLLKAQYANGGWPQFYPRPKGYYIQITYNDNAMVNVMQQLRQIYEKQAPFAFITDELAAQTRKAFDKGVECILNTQVKQNGKLTVWCAQHDRETLAPCKARAYELPSLSGAESDNIVLLLMSLQNPSDRVKAAIEGAVAWFDAVRIKGMQKEYFTNAQGKKDFKMVPCTDCPDLWARFYELEDNRPFFSDRDSKKVYDISEIGYERRNGYSWYNTDGTKVMKHYAKWKKNLEKETK